jgi:putative salt-induced outer membrane protein
MSLAAPARLSLLVRAALGALLTGLLAATAHAQDLPPGWSGKGQVGYVMSRGNSDTDALNANLNVNLVSGDWKHNLLLDDLFGRSNGITSAERWDARLQSDYQISARWFGFGVLNYQNDKFSGFVYQASASGGLGYKVLDSETTKLSVQLGVGYRQLRQETLVKDSSGAVIDRIPVGDTERDPVGTAGVDFFHQFTPTTKLIDKLVIESGSSNTSIKNDLSLEVKINKKLSLAAGYSVIRNSEPPAPLKRTDTTTTLNLVYAFPDPKS